MSLFQGLAPALTGWLLVEVTLTGSLPAFVPARNWLSTGGDHDARPAIRGDDSGYGFFRIGRRASYACDATSMVQFTLGSLLFSGRPSPQCAPGRGGDGGGLFLNPAFEWKRNLGNLGRWMR